MVSTRCLKYFSVAYTILFVISGFVVLGYSSVIFYRLFPYLAFIANNVINPLCALVGVGLVIIFGTWVGWKGVTREHRPHIIMFNILIIIIIGSEIAIAIWDFVEYHRFEDETVLNLNESFQKFAQDYNNSSTQSWDKIQKNLRCCGLDGPSGYHHLFPASCCAVDSGPEGPYKGSCPGIYQRGCVAPLIDHTQTQVLRTIYLSIFACFLQIGGVFCMYNYSKSIWRDQQNRRPIPTVAQTLLNNSTTSTVSAGEAAAAARKREEEAI